ncbi:GNA1162 family protein [Anaeromyxobacter sp. Fw109-5]|uniref:GNA1162 family protein n=1 Tax=Anaeromyxobacter sp. (strain Fw109-5) TaxID=404589 RepID=UPI0000ED8206|nr:GNA1162 family protein [Anaeromyxobacter sp. Fw109-5]ABS26036.1 lipoprotein, putative [Anaeromyxobacter sp. Fw109-5]
MSCPSPSRLATVALLLATACSSGPQRTYTDPSMDFGAIRTVAVLPFQNLSREQTANQRVRDVFVTLLLAAEAVYVVPTGETARGLEQAVVANPTAPSIAEVVKLGTILKADAVITGVVKEYGEIRSGTATSNAVSISIQLQEAGTGKVVWSGASTKGGIGFTDRLFGGGGEPLNRVTEEAVRDILDQLFR